MTRVLAACAGVRIPDEQVHYERSRSRGGEDDHVERPAVATLLTTAALGLLLSFKDPQTARRGNAANGATPQAACSRRPGATQQAAVEPGPAAGSGYQAHWMSVPCLTGSAVDIGYGVVQVPGDDPERRSSRNPDAAAAPRWPFGSGSSYAAPSFRSEALQAQSAQINTVSGATYTSEATSSRCSRRSIRFPPDGWEGGRIRAGDLPGSARPGAARA